MVIFVHSKYRIDGYYGCTYTNTGVGKRNRFYNVKNVRLTNDVTTVGRITVPYRPQNPHMVFSQTNPIVKFNRDNNILQFTSIPLKKTVVYDKYNVYYYAAVDDLR